MTAMARASRIGCYRPALRPPRMMPGVGCRGAGRRTTSTRTRRWPGGSPTSRQAASGSPRSGSGTGRPISLSLGDAADLDPALLAAMLGPDGLGGQALSPAFGQGRAADALRPGPVLAALTEQAVADPRPCPTIS